MSKIDDVAIAIHDSVPGKLTLAEARLCAVAAMQAGASPSILSAPDEKLLSRREAAELLTALGLRTSPATLATWASRRPDGPLIQHFGRYAKYQAGDLRRWAAAQRRAEVAKAQS